MKPRVRNPIYIFHTCPQCDGAGEIEALNGAWLREKRLAAGVGLREMARRLSHSPAYVSDVERGKRAVPKAWLPYYRLTAKGER